MVALTEEGPDWADEPSVRVLEALDELDGLLALKAGERRKQAWPAERRRANRRGASSDGVSGVGSEACCPLLSPTDAYSLTQGIRQAGNVIPRRSSCFPASAPCGGIHRRRRQRNLRRFRL